MALIKRVRCLEERECSKRGCEKPIQVGEEAIKDRRQNSKGKKTAYMHVNCYTSIRRH